MSQSPTQSLHSTEAADVPANLASFVPRLRAENKASSTITTYGKAVSQLADFLEATGMPTEVAHVHREHLEAFLVSLQERKARPATVSQRYRSLQQYFRWLADEGEAPETARARVD